MRTDGGRHRLDIENPAIRDPRLAPDEDRVANGVVESHDVPQHVTGKRASLELAVPHRREQNGSLGSELPVAEARHPQNGGRLSERLEE
jgi:hypothetical protein